MAKWREMTRDGARLACRDFGGVGRPVLLLHGLAGHAGEWTQTATWLTQQCRVIAPDARGHGRSERFPTDVSRESLVADAAFVVKQLKLQPVVAIGQSLGGLTALSLAARHPELVRALVVLDASPEGGGEGVDEAVAGTVRALQQWPVPFVSRSAAEAFFVERFGGRLAAQAWTNGLEHAEDGWRPRFDVEVMAQTLREAVSCPSWAEWENIACPTLVVRAQRGVVEPETAREMVARLPVARVVELANAGHDLHLDRPDEFREVLSDFLDSLQA